MTTFRRLKKDLELAKDQASAVSDIACFIGLLLAAAPSGGLTVPFAIAQCAKALEGTTKLLSSFIGTGNPRESGKALRERFEMVFFACAQESYLSALRESLQSIPPDSSYLERDHAQMLKETLGHITAPEDANAAFDFGWSTGDAPLDLFRSYSAYATLLLRSFSIDNAAASTMISEVERKAQEMLHLTLATRDPWIAQYLMLQRTASLSDFLHDYKNPMQGGWDSYHSSLQQAPELPIWGELNSQVSIRRLFVEADFTYYRRSVHETPVPRSVGIPLLEFLKGLLSGRQPSSELVFVMGGPGTGKTSLMEIFVSSVASSGESRVALIPAKKLNAGGSILQEVRRVLQEAGREAVANSLLDSRKITIVIDGFDELAQATRSTIERLFTGAQDAVREHAKNDLRIVLTGRQTLFAANDVAIPAGSHVLSILPFDEPRVRTWSDNWNRISQKQFDGVAYLQSGDADLAQIASQPMLLYLLARMFEDGRGIPTSLDGDGTGRYLIYKQILNWVCERQESKLPGGSIDQLRRFLQVAGLSTHQIGEQTLHLDTLKRAAKRTGIAEEPLLEAKSYKMILSFAFSTKTHQSWEFTHKSFGEALAAEFVEHYLEDFLAAGRKGSPWNTPPLFAAREWISMFGPHAASTEVLDFVAGWLHQDKGRIPLLVNRLQELADHLTSKDSAGTVSEVCSEWNLSPIRATSNALISWLALLNRAVEACTALTSDEIGLHYAVADKVVSSISISSYKEIVLAAQLSNEGDPESEYARLFRFSRLLVVNESGVPSRSFLVDDDQQMAHLLVYMNGFNFYPSPMGARWFTLAHGRSVLGRRDLRDRAKPYFAGLAYQLGIIQPHRNDPELELALINTATFCVGWRNFQRDFGFLTDEWTPEDYIYWLGEIEGA